ncbi:hypothetical protein Syn7803C99_140 [Synechococcus phage ACG-2014a]|uniref:Gp165 n=1 Tax=Synechococcus phage ACG-2014a TaxID=1493507 RepID=A0A0E3HGE3_9CAUD|nr:hypothetical protein Syn7803C47_143 [Synechococcus phage ACG-2014a]AIX17156.1 hypothetical protein Syn7803C60_140 [Synechococcus phage ACG-2014a]AIX23123.1 hypothetical protein Syn7803C99_140 [Synechococcus phage ACG-2014a]AIX23827.1 hypothetical protein Syn7803US102_142 [Synechococcus phage ACG-2014a]AIX27294.1 hypothetical protein Syn7803US123_143 [Synechococcus phage ACG-2014a]
MDGCNKQTDIHTDDTRGSVSVHRNLQRTWFKQPNNYSENDRGYKHNRHYKYLLAVTLLFANPSYAETVGGVSATANPVANSSGSVTNQAIQVLQGPYITNTYGGGIQCQGPTRNFTPYVTGSISASKPFEDYYDDPVYDVTDNFGAYDSDGNPMGDGILDNPGDVSFYKKTRTGQKDNYSLGVGFSMTWSTPTDKKLQDLCKEAASSNIEMMKQLTANKRLDFEIARLKNCGNLMKEGISFHPRSPYYKICADVVVQNVTTVKQHRHSIPSVSVPTSIPVSPHSDDAALLGAPLETRP